MECHCLWHFWDVVFSIWTNRVGRHVNNLRRGQFSGHINLPAHERLPKANDFFIDMWPSFFSRVWFVLKFSSKFSLSLWQRQKQIKTRFYYHNSKNKLST